MLAMQLLMSVPQLVQVVDSTSIGHDTATLACLIHNLFCVFRITAQPTHLPMRKQIRCGNARDICAQLVTQTTTQHSLLRLFLDTASKGHQTMLAKNVPSDTARESQYLAFDIYTGNVHRQMQVQVGMQL